MTANFLTFSASPTLDELDAIQQATAGVPIHIVIDVFRAIRAQGVPATCTTPTLTAPLKLTEPDPKDPDQIVSLWSENAELRKAVYLPEAERRLWVLSDFLKRNGGFNRADLMTNLSVSAATAAKDIKRWLEANPGRAEYNSNSKRYEATNHG